MWRTHVMAGVSSLWLLQAVPGGLTAENTAALAVVAAFGALLPDLDAARSKLQSLSVGGVQPFQPVGYLARQRFGHRGALHSLVGLAWIAAFAALIAPLWAWPYSAALVLGYASHLMLDACTKSGIPLLPPYDLRQHLLPKRVRLTTGSPEEEMLFALFACLVLLLLLLHLPR